MKALIEKGFLEQVREKAKSILLSDREQFTWIKNLVYDYIKLKQVILSNKYLLNNQENMDYTILIYSSEPFKFARNCTDYIYDNTTDKDRLKSLKMKTIKTNIEFTIEYEFRQLCSIYFIEPHIEKLIKTQKINQINYFPVEIEIIDICAQLHDLSKFTDWEDLKANFTFMLSSIAIRKEKGLLGGGDINIMKIKIYEEFLETIQCVLIGAFAVDAEKYKYEKLQIIIKEKASDVFDNLKEFVGFKLTMREQDLHIPKDFRSKRYTVYMDDKALLDMFEQASWSIVPYCICKKNDLFIGSKYIILHYLLIDLWIIRVVQNSGKITEEMCNKKLNNIWNLIELVNSTDDKIHGFFGIFRDESVDKKMFNINGKMHYPYYPWLRKNKI